jgi:prepilin-type N-terminal cleavage/methylation domain-containing protein
MSIRARTATPHGFTMIELLFAIAIMGIGIIGILAVFLTGLASAAWAGNSTVGSIEAQTLLTKITSETDAGGNHVYLDRIQTANSVNFPENEWIHAPGNSIDPVLIDPDPSFTNDQSKAKTDLWWQCRVSQFPMDEADPLDATKDDKSQGPYPRGLYQVAIAVYRNVKPGAKRKPLSVYTTLITVQP